MEEKRQENINQEQRILRHLRTFKSITPVEALQEYGIMRLASRISDLKKKGYKFKKRMRKSINRYGEKIRYAEYSLEAKE